LIISDNASTDRTADICRAAAEAEPRISYRRMDENIGAVRNFNETFELGEGDYFMWAADDDRWHPTYVRRCVAALEADHSAVMATTGLRFIDEAGCTIDTDYSIYDNPDLSSGSVAARAGSLVRRGGWYQIYGLARREALARTRCLRDVYGADVVLTMEMALQGPILKVPEILFWFRQYATRTEVARIKRQGHITNEGRVLRARYTYLQESLTETVFAGPLPRRLKTTIAADIIRAAYFEDTPLSRHTRREFGDRTRFAVADTDIGAFVKFASLGGLATARRAGRRSRARLRRLATRHRR
jgi:glycosyltransferase involved in cell wall biosynthesis